MHDYTEAAAQAIESDHRQFEVLVRVDWNNNGSFDHELSKLDGYAVRFSKDQTLSSTTPEELMLIEGYAAASLQIELAGYYNDTPLTGHFAPYNAYSVFYQDSMIPLGVDIHVDLGVFTEEGWEHYRQFTGVVREVDSTRENGTVVLDCLDNVEKLRTNIDIPTTGLFSKFLREGHKRGGLTDSSSLIDMAARSGGFSMGTLPGPDRDDSSIQTVLSVPMHGSFVPEIGMWDNDQEIHKTETWEDNPLLAGRAEAYRSGPHGYLALNAVPKGQEQAGYKKFWINFTTTASYRYSGCHLLGCWVLWEGANVSGDSSVIDVQNNQSHYQLVIEGSNSNIAARVYDNNGVMYTTSFLSMEPGWNYIEARFMNDTGSGNRLTAQARVGNTRTAEKEFRTSLPFDYDQWTGLVTVENLYAISDVEVIYSSYVAPIGAVDKDISVVSNADVSWGRNRITYTKQYLGVAAWDIAKEVSAAEYGVVYFDEQGNFVFKNYTDMKSLRSGSPDRYFDLGDVAGLSLRTTMDSVRNTWKIQTQTGEVAPGILYDLSSDGNPLVKRGEYLEPGIFIAHEGYTYWYFHAPDTLVCPNPNDVPLIAENGLWDSEVPVHGMKTYQGDVYKSPNLYTNQRWDGRGLWYMRIYNGGSSGGYGFLGPNGKLYYRVEGTLLHENNPVTWTRSNSDSVARYGIRTIELKNNFWLQDRYQTNEMLKDVIADFGAPIPVTDDITVAGDPRIQIGDVIEISDPGGMGASIKLQIYGIRREMSDGVGLQDTYSVEVVEPPKQWILGSNAYSILGNSTIL